MKIKIEIDCDNAAFADGFASEVARILRRLAESVEGGYAPEAPLSLRDQNGHAVGYFRIVGD